MSNTSSLSSLRFVPTLTQATIDAAHMPLRVHLNMYLFAVKKKFFLQRCENGHVKHLGSEFHRRPDAAENARPEIMQHNVYDNFYKCKKTVVL